jgi:hypothetical protein
VLAWVTLIRPLPAEAGNAASIPTTKADPMMDLKFLAFIYVTFPPSANVVFATKNGIHFSHPQDKRPAMNCL